VKAKGVW